MDLEIIEDAVRRIVLKAVRAEREDKHRLLERCAIWADGKNVSRRRLVKMLRDLAARERDRDEILPPRGY